MLQAKSQDEMKAYQDAMTKTDPAQMEAAADAFAAKYPDQRAEGCSLRSRHEPVRSGEQFGDKVIEMGRKAIAADPTNPVPLVQVGSALAGDARATPIWTANSALPRRPRMPRRAIDNLDTGLIVPPNAPPDRVAAAKTSILTMAYDTLGMVAMNKKDYAGCRTELPKAVDASKAQPEAVVYLRLSVAQDNLKKYPQALESANKAVQYAPQGSAAQNLAKQQQARLQKLIGCRRQSGAHNGSSDDRGHRRLLRPQPPPGRRQHFGRVAGARNIQPISPESRLTGCTFLSSSLAHDPGRLVQPKPSITNESDPLDLCA